MGPFHPEWMSVQFIFWIRKICPFELLMGKIKASGKENVKIKAKERENELTEEMQGTGFHRQDQAQRRGHARQDLEDVVGKAQVNFVGLHLGSWVQSFRFRASICLFSRSCPEFWFCTWWWFEENVSSPSS